MKTPDDLMTDYQRAVAAERRAFSEFSTASTAWQEAIERLDASEVKAAERRAYSEFSTASTAWQEAYKWRDAAEEAIRSAEVGR